MTVVHNLLIALALIYGVSAAPQCYELEPSTACEVGDLPASSDNPAGGGSIQCSLRTSDGPFFWSCSHSAPQVNQASKACNQVSSGGKLQCGSTGADRECKYEDVKCSTGNPFGCVNGGFTSKQVKEAQLSGDDCGDN